MKKHLIGIFLLAIIMIMLPLHLRFAQKNTTLIGTEPYYYARLAMEDLPETDTGILNSRTYLLEPYHAILAFGYKTIGPITFNLFPAALALASFALFWLFLKTLNIPKPTQTWIMLAYALSPPLIASAVIGNPNSFILTLVLAGAWLLSTRAWPTSILLFTISAYSGFAYAIATLAFLLVLYLLKQSKRTLLCIIPTILILIIGHYPKKPEIQQGIIQYISDFGGIYGFSIFAMLLAIVGAALIWKYKKTYYGAYAITILFLITSFFIPQLLVFANVLISGLAGTALAKLAERKWQLKFLRDAALLVLFCGLLFSSISHSVNLAKMQPTPEIFKALEFPPGTIFSHEKYGFWIESAGHTAVSDEITNDEWDIQTLFQSTDPEKTKHLLKKYNITHILITQEMKNGLVWEQENQGLDFLAENSETFKKIHTSKNIGVWSIQ